MTSVPDFDLVVIGAGPGGFDAALAAAGKGLSVAIVEKDLLGGVCLNRGCIPTKLFLTATRPIAELAAQKRMRVAGGEVTVDLPALQKRKQTLVSATRQAMEKRLRDSGIELMSGLGRLAGRDLVKVESEAGVSEIRFKDLILATGSRPLAFPGLEPDGGAVLDSDGMLELEEVPGDLIVVGGGAVGLEMAEFLYRLGTRITIVEALERLVSCEDEEVSKILAGAAKRRKWDLRLGARVEKVETAGGRAKLTYHGGEVIEADKALIAVGRAPNTQGLELEKHGINLDGRGFIITDEYLRARANVYAVGDVNGRAMLAHTASHQGGYVATHLASENKEPYQSGPIPWCAWGSLETLRVGPTERELKAGGQAPETSQAMLAANPTAQASAETQGLIKIVWLDGRVAGISAVGHAVTHLHMQAVIIIDQGWTRQDAARLIVAHPTLDEALKQALLAPPSPA